MDSLVHKNNRKAIHDALEKLPREVDDTYEEAMKRIQGQNQDDAELADQVLLWICFARRPLSIVELQHALAVDESSTSTQWDALPDEEIMISVCCGLVVIDEESSIVRLVRMFHFTPRSNVVSIKPLLTCTDYTTQEYFDRTRESRYPHAQDRILNTCLKCISFEGINLRFSQTQNPLLDYAETNWYFHALGNLRSDTQNVLLRFLQDEAKAKRYGELMLVNEPYIDSGDIGSFGLMMGTHIAAYLGLHDILASLLERGMATNSSGPANRTPLSFAARQGHQMVVGLLLSRADVDVNCEDAYDCTPLHAALKFGRVNVVDQLLEAGANVSKEDNRGRIPLHLAAARGGLGVAGKLVRAGSDINACDDRGKTPLDYLDELLEER